MTGVIKHPTMTEKAMDDLDFQNKLQFMVDAGAAKPEVAEAVGDQFDVEVVDVIEALGVRADVERADEATVRAGRGTTRGRKYQRPSSVLFVTSEEPSKAARNLAGADVATAREVNAADLAPGGEHGRLTVWTESAVAEVAER